MLTIFGMSKFEYLYDFKGNNEEYRKANFFNPNIRDSIEITEEVIETIMTPENQKVQWNHTKVYKYIIRVIVCVFVFGLLLSVYCYFATIIKDTNTKINPKITHILYKGTTIYNELIVDNVFLMFCYYFGKKLFIKIGLGNS